MAFLFDQLGKWVPRRASFVGSLVSMSLMAVVSLLSGGCSPYMVKGLHLDEVLGPGKSAVQIRTVLGPTLAQNIFRERVPASSLPEWQAWPPVFVQASASTPIIGWREYEYRGPVYNRGVAQAAGMVDALTLGLGEPWAEKQVRGYQEQEKTAVRRIKVWYTVNDMYVGSQVTYDSTVDPNRPITFGAKNGDALGLIRQYQALLGRRIKVDPEVAKLNVRFNYSISGVPPRKALVLLRKMLKDRAGIVIGEGSDGWLHAHVVSAR